MKARHQKVEIWTSQKPKKENHLKTRLNPCPRSQQERKRRRKSASWKSVWIINTCSNQTTNDECQHFGNMIAAKLMNYSETVRCVIQNEIMNVFLNANRGLYKRYHHTHLQPINPPQAHFPRGPSKIYPQNINSPRHTSLSSLCLKTLLRHVLETLLRHQSVSAITQFCLTVFPQKAFRQLRHLQKVFVE